MIAAKVATVDLVVELNLPLSTLVRINKVFKKSLRIQTLLKAQLKMFLFLVLSSSFLCLLFFFFVIRGRHVCCISRARSIRVLRMKMALVVPFPSTKPHCSSAISGFILFLTLIMMIQLCNVAHEADGSVKFAVCSSWFLW